MALKLTIMLVVCPARAAGGWRLAAGSSANSGIELSGVTQFLIVKEQVGKAAPEDQRLALSVIHDKPQDGDGGAIAFNFSAPGAGFPYFFEANTGDNTNSNVPPFLVRDDVTHHLDGYFFDNETESGECHWAYAACCTDGASIGPLISPLESVPYEITIKFTELIDAVNVTGANDAASRGDPWSQEVYFRNAPPLQPTHLIRLPTRNGTIYPELRLRPGACAPRPPCDYGCFECQAHPEWGWCGATQTCHDRTCDDAFAACPTAEVDATCPTATYCAARDTCEACAVETVCTSCSIFDNSTLSVNTTCIAKDLLNYNFTTCESVNDTLAFCPQDPSVTNSTRGPTNVTQPDTIDISDLIPAPAPGESIPVWIFIAIGVAVFVLFAVLVLVIWKLLRVQQEVASIVAFEDTDDIKSNPLFEDNTKDKLNPLYAD